MDLQHCYILKSFTSINLGSREKLSRGAELLNATDWLVCSILQPRVRRRCWWPERWRREQCTSSTWPGRTDCPQALRTAFVPSPAVFVYYLFQCCESGMFITDPNFPIPDPGSASKNLSILTQKIVSMRSEIWSGLFISDPDLGIRILIFHPYRIPDPGVKNAPDPGANIYNIILVTIIIIIT